MTDLYYPKQKQVLRESRGISKVTSWHIFQISFPSLHNKQAGRSNPLSAIGSAAKKNSVMSFRLPPAALQIKPEEHKQIHIHTPPFCFSCFDLVQIRGPPYSQAQRGFSSVFVCGRILCVSSATRSSARGKLLDTVSSQLISLNKTTMKRKMFLTGLRRCWSHFDVAAEEPARSLAE